MKKRTINAFTLVEMLIVIVIIGILIAALMPRMQAAQWRARDVSRKTALSQIQSAIVVSQWDLWKWPWTQDCGSEGDTAVCATNGIDVIKIEEELKQAGMNGVPTDPLDGNKVTWVGDEWSEWQFRYMVTTRNWAEKWWFVLMAKTEVAGWSNWVMCSTDQVTKDNTSNWGFTSEVDIAQDVTLCETVTKSDSEDCATNTSECFYKTEDQLRYIALY